MKEKKIYKKLIDKIEFSEIDFDLHRELGYDMEEDYIDLIGDRGRADGYPIAIDRIIDKLNEMKSKGATHVELDYHCDHIGYLIDGYKLTEATEDEVIETKMKRFPEYMEKVREQLECNASEHYKNNYVTYGFSNEYVDENIEYFKESFLKGLSAYKALLFLTV